MYLKYKIILSQISNRFNDQLYVCNHKSLFQLTAEKFRKKTDKESVSSEQDAAAIAEGDEDDDVFDEAKPAALEEKPEDAESGGKVYKLVIGELDKKSCDTMKRKI